MPGVDWNSLTIESRERADCEVLLDIAFANDLTQLVQEGTRETGTAQSILDIEFLDGRFEDYQVAVENGISDHQLVFVQIKADVPASNVKECIAHVPNFDKADDTSIIDYLSFHLDSLSPDDDVNSFVDKIQNHYLSLWKFIRTIKKKEKEYA